MKAKRRAGKNRKKGRDERELERLVARTGLKGSARDMATQYGRGMLDGMHIVYLGVVTRLLRAGNTRDEISAFLEDMLDGYEIERLLEEAEQPRAAQIA